MADDKSRRLWDNLSLGYTESQGHPLLREAVARQYENIQPDDIVITSPVEGIYLAMQTILRKSDQFIVPAPAYQALYEVGRASGCKHFSWELRPQAGRWHLDNDFLTAHISRRMRLFVLNFPHNPSGYLPTLEQLTEIVEIARKHDIFIFSDEMYRGLEYDSAARLPAICDIYEKGLSLGGVSKSLSLPGLRIGWLATGHRALRQNLLRMKDYTTICNSAPSEILALIGLGAGEKILQRNRALIAENLALAESFFMARPDLFEWLAPQGGSTAFPRYLGGAVEEWCDDLVAKKSLMILPGTVYDKPGGFFRIGLGRTNFSEALGVLESYLDENGQ